MRTLKTIICAFLSALILCSCVPNTPKQNENSTTPPSITEVTLPSIEPELTTAPEAEDDTLLFPDIEVVVESIYPQFYEPFDTRFDNVPIELVRLVPQDGLQDWLASKRASGGKLTDMMNIYTVIKEFDIPREAAEEALQRYLQSDDKQIAITHDELDLIYSGDEKAIIAHFANEYAIIIEDRIYTPWFIYGQSLETIEAHGITAEMLENKVDAYINLCMNDDIKYTFAKKLYQCVGKPIYSSSLEWDIDTPKQLNAYKFSIEFITAINNAAYFGGDANLTAYTSSNGLLKYINGWITDRSSYSTLQHKDSYFAEFVLEKLVEKDGYVFINIHQIAKYKSSPDSEITSGSSVLHCVILEPSESGFNVKDWALPSLADYYHITIRGECTTELADPNFWDNLPADSEIFEQIKQFEDEANERICGN